MNSHKRLMRLRRDEDRIRSWERMQMSVLVVIALQMAICANAGDEVNMQTLSGQRQRHKSLSSGDELQERSDERRNGRCV